MVELPGPFAARGGDAFDILVAETIAGDFDAIVGKPGPGLEWVALPLTDQQGSRDVLRLVASTDADGVPNVQDNCIFVAKATQLDADLHLIGNACDCDFDQGRSCSIADFNLFLPGFRTGAPGPSGLVP